MWVQSIAPITFGKFAICWNSSLINCNSSLVVGILIYKCDNLAIWIATSLMTREAVPVLIPPKSAATIMKLPLAKKRKATNSCVKGLNAWFLK